MSEKVLTIHVLQCRTAGSRFSREAVLLCINKIRRMKEYGREQKTPQP
nr:MAG TPA: hypothetical protein [Caudoviricetes sp.]